VDGEPGAIELEDEVLAPPPHAPHGLADQALGRRYDRLQSRERQRYRPGERVACHPRAEPFPEAAVRALADEVQVELTERGQEPVGVVHLPLVVAGAVAQPVAGEVGGGHLRLEDAHLVDPPHRHHPAGMGDGHGDGVGVESANHRDSPVGVDADQLMGIAMDPIGEAAHLVGAAGHIGGGAHGVASSRKPSGTDTHWGRWASS